MRTTLLLSALILAGCATTSSTVKPATPEQVAACTYLDDVSGTSSLYGMFASMAADEARENARAKAQKLGATHIVWTPVQIAQGNTAVTGKAYRCN